MAACDEEEEDDDEDDDNGSTPTGGNRGPTPTPNQPPSPPQRHVLDTSTLVPARGFIIQGDMTGDELGISVAGAGDINGDGLDDLIVGAWAGDDGGNEAGEAYIIYGKAGTDGTQFGTAMNGRQVLDTTNLASADGFLLQGDAEEDALGWSVAGAGDINGDGFDDLVVGAWEGEDGGEFAGEAYILYGKAGATGSQFGTMVGSRQVLDTTNLAPADGFILQGDEVGDQLGVSVAGAGDVNGDGLADLVVGANRGNDGGEEAGEAYVVYGKAGTQFGTAVRLAADGTTIADGSTPDGSVLRQVLDTTRLAPTDGFILQGDAAGDQLGYAVAGAGDLNGDGLADLIVGAWRGDNGGEAYIIYGKAGTDGTQFGTRVGSRQVLNTTNLASNEGFIIRGDGAGDRLGWSVAGAGDINGDGFDDLVVGAWQGDDGGVDAGEAYIVYGKAGTQFGTLVGSRQVLDTTNLAPAAGFIIQGDRTFDLLGYSVSGAGDINGDGLADLIVGAVLGDDGGTDAGEAYILYGKAGTNGTQFGTRVGSRQVLDTTGLAPTDGFILQGDEADDELGISVSGAGDINGDGFDDLIVGTTQGEDGVNRVGEAYVVYGGVHLGNVATGDATRTGLAGDLFLLGGAGDDMLTAHADTEVLYGGAGDDTLELADASFRRVDGGSGSNTLVLGSSVTLDLTDAAVRGRVRGVEVISLSDATAEVTLNLAAVYALVETRNNGGTLTDAGEVLLRLEGTSGIAVLADASSWTVKTADAEGMPDLYAQGSAKLLIDDGLFSVLEHVLDVSELTPARGFILQGAMEDYLFGSSVSGAGDINGDGLADFIVGAPEGHEGGTGEAYIIYGKAATGDGVPFGMAFRTAADGTTITDGSNPEGSVLRQVLDTTDLAPAAGFIIQGDAEGDELGRSVSSAGDLNGDGFDDLVVGAWLGDDGGSFAAGEAYIIYGKAGAQFGTVIGSSRVLDTTALAPADGFILQGDEAGDFLGTSVSGAGDINGDGLADLIVGARDGGDGGVKAGEAYIIYGKAGTDGTQFGMEVQTPTNSVGRRVVDTTALASTDGFIIQGDEAGDALGFSVAGAGDINGDGLGDLIVGAFEGDDGGNKAGEAYILYGKALTDGIQFGMNVNGRQVLDTTHLTPADGFILQGNGAEDQLGVSVAGAGDINGDGYDDLIIGTQKGDAGGIDAGEAYVIYGKAGTGTGSQFGTSVRVQTRRDENGRTTRTTITDGSNPEGSVVRQVLDITNLDPDEGFIIQGDVRGDALDDDRLGTSVSGAGDLNGDGLADLIVGDWLGDDGGTDAGEAYILYGKAGTAGTQFGTMVGNRQVLDTTKLASTDGFILQGDARRDELGRSVAGAGDINGDGFDDLIVGALDEEAYVVYGGTHLGEVVTNDQTRTGMAGDLFLLGGAGDDTLTAHADTGVLYGGAGDDTLVLADDSFRRVDGGSGDNTLVLGSGVKLDLTDVAVRGRVRGVEEVSLSDATAEVTLDLAAVYALVETRDNGGTLTDAGEVLLRLKGTSGRVGLLDESAWRVKPAEAEGMPDLYVQGSAKLLIDDGLLSVVRHVLDVSELAPAHGFILQGDARGDKLGRSVAGAGDINGDGYDDLIVGAYQGDDGDIDAGEAYIIYGKTGTPFGEDVNGRQVLDATRLPPADGFLLQGDAVGDALGRSVAGAGDLNGDGFEDLIVGAPEGNDGGNNAGEAYIIYGKAGTPFGEDVNGRQVLDATILAPTEGFILQGEAAGNELGLSVAGAGDVNGDGLDDLIVGAHQHDNGLDEAGGAYIIYGKAGADGMQFGMAMTAGEIERQVLDTTNLAPAAGFFLQGDMEFDQLGLSVAGAGDINGDGLADLVVGANQGDDGGDRAGEAYLIYGKAGTSFGMLVGSRQVLDTASLALADGFLLQGDAEEDALGLSVAGAGDINGDGFDDLIVGASAGDDGGMEAGEAYLIYGKTGTPFGEDVNGRQVLDTTNLAPADGFLLQGDAAFDNLGVSVSGAGDINGDGLADLIVGAHEGNDGGMDAGEAYIIYGKAGTDGTQFGMEVRLAADGTTTITDGTVPDESVARQVLDTTELAPTDGFILQGDAEGDQLGFSVAGAGDINGDGFEDLVVGAPEGGDGGDMAGESYVIYGGSHLGDVATDDATRAGVAGEAFLLGGAGADTLTAHADTEVLYGGAGDDVLELADTSFRRVDGGSGHDTLVLGSSVTLDLTADAVRGRVRDVEVVSLSDAAAMVTLDLATVYALVEARDNGGDLTDPGEVLLRLEGVSSAMVVLSDAASWTVERMNAEGTADLYAQGSARLLVDDGLLA